MQKETTHIFESNHSGFSWVREPSFTPPGVDGGVTACVTQEFTAPRAGELRTLLETFLDSILGTVRATAGVVRVLSPDGRMLEIISSSGLSAELQEEAESFSELDCEGNDIGLTAHASDISNCDSRPNCRHASCRFQSKISAPFAPGSASNPQGLLTIFFDVPCKEADRHMRTIVAFAQMMSATIDYTRINRELKRSERLAARQGIANDIHDSLAQTLIYSRMRVSLLQESVMIGDEGMATKFAHDLDEALEVGQQSLRKLIKDFRCEMNAAGLLTALNEITAEFRERNDIVLEYHNRLVDLELPLEYEIQVYHIVKEALTNIARHSGATHARLFVDANFGYYVFTIEDNGSGASTFAPVEGHYGVMIMRERAQRIGGKLRVESAAGLGTQVQLFFPEPASDWRATNE